MSPHLYNKKLRLLHTGIKERTWWTSVSQASLTEFSLHNTNKPSINGSKASQNTTHWCCPPTNGMEVPNLRTTLPRKLLKDIDPPKHAPIWKNISQLGSFPQVSRGENKRYLKPPPSFKHGQEAASECTSVLGKFCGPFKKCLALELHNALGLMCCGDALPCLA